MEVIAGVAAHIRPHPTTRGQMSHFGGEVA